MEETIFKKEHGTSEDKVEMFLLSISQNIVVFVFGLLPLFFIPTAHVSLEYAKVVFVIVGMLLAIIFFSLSVLRSGQARISAPWALGGFWIVGIATVVSALLSGDMRDAFLGDNFGVHTALFVVLMVLSVTVMLLIGQTKSTIMRLYVLLTGSAVLLGIFHLVRLVFGSETLSLNTFASLVSSPIGGWNDLALFFTLSILLSLVALEQLPLTKWGKILFSTVASLALIMLAVVNFFAVWVILGLVSLVVLMYSLTKDRFSEKTLTLEGKKSSVSIQSILLSVSVFIVSLIFVIGGGGVGAYISKITDISYIEVRPSFSATVDIARSVFSENALVGIGPNKFVDAWRLYKDPSINQTIFWATDFNGGSGYITTLFVTTGILGVLSWLLFLGLLLFAGFRLLFRSGHVDRFWYFIGSSSFAASVYLWGMSLIYVPGVTVLLLAAVFTSIMFTAYAALIPTKALAFSIETNKQAGFVLVGVVMIIIVASTTGLYFVGQNYASAQAFGSAVYGLQNGDDIKSVEEKIAGAYASSKNESYALELTSLQLSKINALVNAGELSDVQKQELQSSITNGIGAAQIAISQDPTDALNWVTLGSIYSVLAGASVEGAKEKAKEAFGKAVQYDPLNPLYKLLTAQLESRTGDMVAARTNALEAIQLKQNYTDALFFLTQIDVSEGRVEDAINTTQAIISLEPNNPARYYQLGILQSANKKLDDAIVSFNQAVALDANYANARYYLAIALAQKNDIKGAVEQLEAVLALNPGNAQVMDLIAQLKAGNGLESLTNTTQEQAAVTEPETVTSVEDTVTTTEAPDTSLITTVNTVGDTQSSTTEQ
jgi:cytochrome c-type biogenesis protein CcmH/NrfG